VLSQSSRCRWNNATLFPLINHVLVQPSGVHGEQLCGVEAQ